MEELRKALNERCKQLGLRTKLTALIELPYGWKPSIQENATEWDDDWDKFEDEGFSIVQDLMNEPNRNKNKTTGFQLIRNANPLPLPTYSMTSNVLMYCRDENRNKLNKKLVSGSSFC